LVNSKAQAKSNVLSRLTFTNGLFFIFGSLLVSRSISYSQNVYAVFWSNVVWSGFSSSQRLGQFCIEVKDRHSLLPYQLLQEVGFTYLVPKRGLGFSASSTFGGVESFAGSTLVSTATS